MSKDLAERLEAMYARAEAAFAEIQEETRQAAESGLLSSAEVQNQRIQLDFAKTALENLRIAIDRFKE